MDPTDDKQAIETTIRDMNRCWTGTWDEARFQEYIHPAAVAIVPTTPGCLEGRDAYVAGWRGFTEAATIHSWDEQDLRIRLHAYGSNAVVTYLFIISFTMAGRWLVVADQFSPEPFPS